ncbi:hypothetical protein DBR36_03260 [Microbacterium sp. HMWF026]|jgi:2-oxoglutarate dehydrogenase E1 component|uniref:hypothetical protein n=1 Tax=Microbacterium sp. HMWF026 TaxID=2056861 RepID=UPI000D35DF52|nr:hypothetical protein [Microbacterium sp. HMWF026]PTT21789.1 hypothetical protein DBR36_03260 [Microbacterium sp. HMWF026]
MSTPSPFPGSPAEPTAPTPSEPTAPTPAEPTIPLTPETQPGPASGGDGGAGAFAREQGDAVGSAEMDADNAVEQDVIDAVDPGGSPD